MLERAGIDPERAGFVQAQLCAWGNSAARLRPGVAALTVDTPGCDSGMEMGLEFENVEIGLGAGGVAALTGEAVSARSGLESVYAWCASRSRGHGRTLRKARSDE